MIGFLWSFFLHKYFFDVVRNKLQTINIYTRINKKKIKNLRKEYIIRTCFKFWPMKNIFEVSYLYWQNRYPNLKTTCHIKLKFSWELNSKRVYSLQISHICHCDFKLSHDTVVYFKEFHLYTCNTKNKPTNFYFLRAFFVDL